MIYAIIFLLILGGWQAFMRGRKSKAISGFSLWLALIILIIGLIIGKIELNIALFAMFILASFFILMQIYRLSTYHRYFFKMVPVLLGYGALIGYLLFAFNFSKYFIWFIALTLCLLFTNFHKQLQDRKISISLAKDEEQKKFLTKSVTNTIKFHLLSSIIYVIMVVVSFLIFL